ncbi:MBL fold metallo-hydrolase [Pseudoroseomonas wenyumeiae]
MTKLDWKILTKKRGSSTQGIPPGKEDLAWVNNTVTLLTGDNDAVLIDTFLPVQQSKELVEWVAESGKNLTTIYVTHAHGDHYFGLALLLERFPAARAIAARPVAEAIKQQIEPAFIKSFWEPRFSDQLPESFAAPQAVEGRKFEARRRGTADCSPWPHRYVRDHRIAHTVSWIGCIR